MSRKDTIIIAVLVNAGLLAILFATAWHGDDLSENVEVNKVVSQPPVIASPISVGSPITPPKDEIDQVLLRYTAAQQAQANGVLLPTGTEVKPVQSEVVTVASAGSTTESSSPEFIEITVKRGDVLAKIAKANGTTVDKIMKANNLPNVNLQIGQILKIPKSVKSDAVAAKPPPVQETSTAEVQYYTVQSGDNPWSIARKHQVPLDELLKMNKLNNESARNLKVGDKLRVR